MLGDITPNPSELFTTWSWIMNTTRQWSVVVIAIAFAAAAASAPADIINVPITTADGNGADAYVQFGNPTTNNGSSTTLLVKDSGAASTTRKIYTRFDLSSVNVSAILNAQLSLVVTSHDAGGSTLQTIPVELWGLIDSASGQNWVEGNGGTDNSPAGEITWNNAPANNTGGNGLTANAVQLASFNIGTGVAVGATVNVSSAALVNFLRADTDGLVTLILRRNAGNSANNLGFASKENTTFAAPTLTLTIPAPAALPAGLSLLTLLTTRRKRN
ncbi:MAG: DNRLRE domain-containing protein [Planctomycetes bacterium]|nr:DNRLRE domain-containing protein [Planctomycetota bacterium]